MKQAYEITDDDLLSWELQLQREGTLPPEAQRLLLEAVKDLTEEIASLNDEISDWISDWEDGRTTR